MLNAKPSHVLLASCAFLLSGCTLSYQAPDYDREAFTNKAAQHENPAMARQAIKIFDSAAYQRALQSRGNAGGEESLSSHLSLIWTASDPSQPKTTERYRGYVERRHVAESADSLFLFYDTQGHLLGMLDAKAQLLLPNQEGKLVAHGTSTVNSAIKQIFNARHFHAIDSQQYVETTLLRKLPEWDSEAGDIRGVTPVEQEAYLRRLDMDAAGTALRVEELEEEAFDRHVSAQYKEQRIARRGPATKLEEHESDK